MLCLDFEDILGMNCRVMSMVVSRTRGTQLRKMARVEGSGDIDVDTARR